MKVIYILEFGLQDVLKVTDEIRYETGMEPEYIELEDGRRIDFSHTDIRKIENKKLTELEYIARHRIK